jgi:hypothetical protein
MSNPELASGFSNPKVQAAIIDISQNPMNIVKYQNDPEVRYNKQSVYNEMPSIFHMYVFPRHPSTHTPPHASAMQIMKVLEKVTEVFQPNIPPANRT